MPYGIPVVSHLKQLNIIASPDIVIKGAPLANNTSNATSITNIDDDNIKPIITNTSNILLDSTFDFDLDDNNPSEIDRNESAQSQGVTEGMIVHKIGIDNNTSNKNSASIVTEHRFEDLTGTEDDMVTEYDFDNLMGTKDDMGGIPNENGNNELISDHAEEIGDSDLILGQWVICPRRSRQNRNLKPIEAFKDVILTKNNDELEVEVSYTMLYVATDFYKDINYKKYQPSIPNKSNAPYDLPVQANAILEQAVDRALYLSDRGDLEAYVIGFILN
jgi:hypothetical protein